jgi:ABC-2 type transport system permease protein
MSARRAVWEVARREIVERSRSRVLRISLALLLVLAVGGAIAAARTSSGTPHDDVGIVGARSLALEPALQLQAKAAGRAVRLHRLSLAAARAQVRDGTLDVAVVDGSRLVVRRSRTEPAVRQAQAAVAAQAAFERLRGAGLNQAQALSVLAPRPLPVDVLEPDYRGTERNRGLLYAGMLILFTALIGFGQAVASSVAEEKSSRVVELLLTTVSPRRLLTGKVAGTGLLGLGLLVLPGAAALAAGRLAGGKGLPSAAPEAIALVVLWFLLGYALYSVVYAALGALVSRHEDLDTATVPVNVVIIGSWIIAVIALNDPNGTLARICAFIPPLAPLVVPARMVLGDMTALGLAAAIAIDLLATAGLMLLAARIYERAILRGGPRLRLGQLLSADSPQRAGRLLVFRR